MIDDGLAPPLTEQAAEIERLWDAMLIGALVVGVLVIALIVYVVVRYRRRDDRLPFQRRENVRIEATYVIVPLIAVAVIFAVTFVSVRYLDEMDDDPDLTVDVTGFQWQWQFAYPDEGVRVIGSDAVEPELVLPAGAKVQFDLHSADVIHSFWIPGFRFKRDMFPGQTQSFQVDVGDLTGSWPDSGVCAEFCGLDHHKMRFSVRIVSTEEFQQWVQEERTE